MIQLHFIMINNCLRLKCVQLPHLLVGRMAQSIYRTELKSGITIPQLGVTCISSFVHLPKVSLKRHNHHNYLIIELYAYLIYLQYVYYMYINNTFIVHHTVYNVQFTIYSVYSSVNIIVFWCVQCGPYTVHCTLYTVHCTLYIIHCTLYTVHCTLYIEHCTLYNLTDIVQVDI